MISRWKAARTSSAMLVLLSGAVLALVSVACPAAEPIRRVRFAGAHAISASELERGSLLRKGLAYGDSLVSLELARVDSLYFNAGRLGVGVEVDTVRAREGVDVSIVIAEGEAARVGKVTVSGSGLLDEAAVVKRVRPATGETFDPFALEASLAGLLAFYNESGYPFTQVWLTGFTYRKDANEVDLALSIFEGERSRISRVIFEGLTRTDSTTARRTSRLRSGALFKEEDLAVAKRYLVAAGLFESVGDPRIEARPGGKVDVFIPVVEVPRSNLFQGALGFSRQNEGRYLLNGSVELDLRNIAGKGRNAHFDWLNDGRLYSRLKLKFREPFLLSSPVSLDAEIAEVVEDSVFTWYSGGIYFAMPLSPHLTAIAGAAADRNVPNAGDLLRSVRQRYRVGLTAEASAVLGVNVYVEGAYKSNYLRGNRSENEGQILTHLDGRASVGAFRDESIYVRLLSDAVFTSGAIPLAETFPLGGATTLRGYREAQFRAERYLLANVEYRFGEGGWFYLFDDVAGFFRAPEGWLVKNGLGFGIRSESSLGVVSLAFGVGDQFSFEGTRIHISLLEKF